ncbi:MAG TPA: SDR family oxidoreductase [Anaerolineales bacterium]|nr:SDR family oxidoreductase [Anaerolineales bacterium]
MKLTIFGATSPTGKLLVEKALAQGHEVTAFVREETKLRIEHERLRVVRGDALNSGEVESAIRGSDAVLSTLGPKGKPAVMVTESTRNIVTAMQKHGIRRLVVVSVAGIAVPQDRRGFNLVSALIKLLLKDVFLDRQNQIAVLESSNLDWIAVRVSRLIDAPATGSVKAFFGNASPRMKVSRGDLADFMLKQLTEDRWIRQAPILRN